MATSTIARVVDFFCVSVGGHLKTLSGLILIIRFSYQLGQRKAFIRDNNNNNNNNDKMQSFKCNYGSNGTKYSRIDQVKFLEDSL